MATILAYLSRRSEAIYLDAYREQIEAAIQAWQSEVRAKARTDPIDRLFRKDSLPATARSRARRCDAQRTRRDRQNGEHRRNQHSAARKGEVSGILGARQRESGQPQEPQHSGPKGRRDRLHPGATLLFVAPQGYRPQMPSHSFGQRSSWPRSAAVDRSANSSGTQERWR